MTDRTSRKQLEELETTLSARDKNILSSILEYRYLSTNQIMRLHFTEAANPTAGLRAASRNLKKLKTLNLLTNLERRVGGAVQGSGSYVWRLEAAGDHLLRLTNKAARPQKKRFEPSKYFLAHTLAVSECYVRITEICREKGMKLTEIRNEPENWRPYTIGGKLASLKPDLFVITICDRYEDRWFIEVDLATESPVKIIEKCRRYLEYYRSGLEQRKCGVFPLVVFLVPDTARKESIARHIRKEFAKQPRIFAVIAPEELEPVIRQGAEGITLC